MILRPLLLGTMVVPFLLTGCSTPDFGTRKAVTSSIKPQSPRLALKRNNDSFNTERYDQIVENAFQRTLQTPLSTFSIDVDTAAYANVRRFLTSGSLPTKDAVRIEEMINYFDYDYPAPQAGESFAVHTEVNAAPWNPRHRLVRIALKGKDVPASKRPMSNLVFLLDVSGSMYASPKLPLLKQAFRVLVDNLRENDRVSIVVYAGASGVVLPPTTGDRKTQIMNAINQLRAGGSTHGSAGIKLAYEMALKHYAPGGINRVILATDGDMNVGVTSRGALIDLVKERAKGGVMLTVLGFGTGNLKDSAMEQIANQANGNYAYIDSLKEARKVLGTQIGGTLMTIAKDVKIQVEFNPAHVAGYRLIGYENRMLSASDFNDDSKDAGELGAGHTVTALYEIIPKGLSVPTGQVDALKYQSSKTLTPLAATAEMMTVKLRYKEPAESRSKRMSVTVKDTGKTLKHASRDFRLATTVALFGMLLRHSKYKGSSGWDDALLLAKSSLGNDRHGYRQELVKLIQKAQSLSKD